MQALQLPAHPARELRHSALQSPTRGCALTQAHLVLPRACSGKLSASLIQDIRSSVQIWLAGLRISGESKVVVGHTDPFVSNGTAQATAANRLWLYFHR